MLAFALISAAMLIAISPWLTGQARGEHLNLGPLTIHLESVILGVTFGLLLGLLGRLHWSEIPRTIVTWLLVRERQLFYWLILAVCVGVILFY
jgi:hypothetical protein